MQSSYSLEVTIAATTYAVSVTELKTELSVSDTAWDAKLALLIVEATEALELATARQLITATLTEWYDVLPFNEFRPMQLHRAPVVIVDSIKYTDTNGNEQTWASTQYTLDNVREPARIAVAYAGTLPSIRDDVLSFRVQYQAGYGAAASVPAAAKEFIYLYCRPRYERRVPTTEEIDRMHALISMLKYDL